MLLTYALLALSADHFFLFKKKSLRVCTLGDNWTREIDFSRHGDNLPSHRGRRLTAGQFLVCCVGLLYSSQPLQQEFYAAVPVCNIDYRSNDRRGGIGIGLSYPRHAYWCCLFGLLVREKQNHNKWALLPLFASFSTVWVWAGTDIYTFDTVQVNAYVPIKKGIDIYDAYSKLHLKNVHHVYVFYSW